MTFPIDLGAFKPLALPLNQTELTRDQRRQLVDNVQLCRDAIIFFTAVADARGLGGHTGGPYDIVPEVLISDAFMRGGDSVVPIYFDEAGHRVAIQYLMAVLNDDLPAERLLHYREAGAKLPGHPERDFTPGVKFSSGRLGHMWPYANGVALANPDKLVVMFGSDGSQMEGDDAEAARLAVAQNINIKLLLDDNDVTIAGHPSNYLPGFDLAKTLQGHGLTVDIGRGEDLDALYKRMQRAFAAKGPIALINQRKMAPGVQGVEGSCHGHDVIKVKLAIDYLQKRGRNEAVAYLQNVSKTSSPISYRGSSKELGKNREVFGHAVVSVLKKMSTDQRKQNVLCIDSDLEGSCGLKHIREAFPEVYINSGVMERGNFSAAAGFGMQSPKQGIFATFSAFLEMCISEITMARLNESNVLCHFSHAGVDDMADNTCHFGVNNFFADNGLGENDHTRLYFPADQHQMQAVIERVFNDAGLRFVFSTRSAVPDILNDAGSAYFGEGYSFTPGKDEIIRDVNNDEGGWVVSFGEMLYRSLDAVERARENGLDVGLINKPTLNVVDQDMLAKIGRSRFVIVTESQNVKTGLGSRFGSWLLERGLTPRFARMGAHKLGDGGLWEHIPHQGLDPDRILAQIEQFAQPCVV